VEHKFHGKHETTGIHSDKKPIVCYIECEFNLNTQINESLEPAVEGD
jgi:hypothetical protein